MIVLRNLVTWLVSKFQKLNIFLECYLNITNINSIMYLNGIKLSLFNNIGYVRVLRRKIKA